MKHINFSAPFRLINPSVKRLCDKPPHERILFTKTITWPKESKPRRDSPSKRRFQK